MTDHRMDPTTLRALAKRVEAGESGRALDGQIMFSLFAKPIGGRAYLWPEDNPSWSFALRTTESSAPFRKGQETVEWECDDGSWILMNSLRVPRLTTSLDAVEALRVRLLPDYTVDIHSGDARDGEGRWYECIMECWSGVDRDEDASTIRSFGFIPETNARLAALLNAVAAKVEADTAADTPAA